MPGPETQEEDRSESEAGEMLSSCADAPSNPLLLTCERTPISRTMNLIHKVESVARLLGGHDDASPSHVPNRAALRFSPFTPTRPMSANVCGVSAPPMAEPFLQVAAAHYARSLPLPSICCSPVLSRSA